MRLKVSKERHPKQTNDTILTHRRINPLSCRRKPVRQDGAGKTGVDQFFIVN
jgi:hypothetical protein